MKFRFRIWFIFNIIFFENSFKRFNYIFIIIKFTLVFIFFSLSDFLKLSKLILSFFDKSLSTFFILSISLLSLLCFNKLSKYSNVFNNLFSLFLLFLGKCLLKLSSKILLQLSIFFICYSLYFISS